MNSILSASRIAKVLAGVVALCGWVVSVRAETHAETIVSPTRHTPPTETLVIEDFSGLIEIDAFEVSTDVAQSDVQRWRVAGLFSFDPATTRKHRHLLRAEFLGLSRDVNERSMPVLTPEGSIGDAWGFAVRGERFDVHNRSQAMELGVRIAGHESSGNEPVGTIYASNFPLPPFPSPVIYWVLETESLLVDIDLNRKLYFDRAGFDLHVLYGARGIHLQDSWQAGDMVGPPRALDYPRLEDSAYNVMAGGQVGVGVARTLARLTIGGTSKFAVLGSSADNGFGVSSAIDFQVFASLHVNDRTEVSVGASAWDFLGVSTTLPSETIFANENSVTYAGVTTMLTYRF